MTIYLFKDMYKKIMMRKPNTQPRWGFGMYRVEGPLRGRIVGLWDSTYFNFPFLGLKRSLGQPSLLSGDLHFGFVAGLPSVKIPAFPDRFSSQS